MAIKVDPCCEMCKCIFMKSDTDNITDVQIYNTKLIKGCGM
jgi:hypothetical protein